MECSFLRSAVARSLFLVACASLCACAQGAPFTSKSALSSAIYSCLREVPTGEKCCSSGVANCGPAGSTDMPDWDVSQVQSMESLFSSKSSFNQDISRWDTSQAVSMKEMFSGATLFNADISGWDVSSVVDMADMFKNTAAFDQDISGWNVGHVKNMDGMFWGSSIDRDISAWDVREVCA